MKTALAVGRGAPVKFERFQIHAVQLHAGAGHRLAGFIQHPALEDFARHHGDFEFGHRIGDGEVEGLRLQPLGLEGEHHLAGQKVGDFEAAGLVGLQDGGRIAPLMVAGDDDAGHRLAAAVNDQTGHGRAVADDHHGLARQKIGGGQAHDLLPAGGGTFAAEGGGKKIGLDHAENEVGKILREMIALPAAIFVGALVMEIGVKYSPTLCCEPHESVLKFGDYVCTDF